MNKKTLVKNIMNNVTKALNEGELIQKEGNKADMKAAYVVDCSYCDEVIMKKLDLFDVMSERMKSGVRIYCPDFSLVLKVVSLFEQFKGFEREALNGKEFGAVKIYKWRKSMNDSVNESAGLREGDFVTDFTYTPDELGDTYTEMQAANLHTKWLKKHGLEVELKENRYSVYIYIHYSNEEQYKDLVKWYAWHIGLSETINNGCPVEDREEVEATIASGKDTIF